MSAAKRFTATNEACASGEVFNNKTRLWRVLLFVVVWLRC
jgi:hypothetical protein